MTLIFLLATAIFVVLAIFLLGAFLTSRQKNRISENEIAFVRNQWRMIALGKSPKNDIIEADKLLDFVLGKYGFAGSIDEKLKKAEKLFSDKNGVWLAHKMRNKLADKTDFALSEFEFRTALENFRRALIDLKIKL